MAMLLWVLSMIRSLSGFVTRLVGRKLQLMPNLRQIQVHLEVRAIQCQLLIIGALRSSEASARVVGKIKRSAGNKKHSRVGEHFRERKSALWPNQQHERGVQ
jgi:hypothetical protein